MTSIKIVTLSVGELATNCYLVWDQKTKEGVIIDPGDEANFISASCLLPLPTPFNISDNQ